MPTISFYLQQNVSGVVNTLTGTWAGLVNNSTSTAYKSTTSSDSNGLLTVNSVPAGTYTVYTSPDGASLPPGGSWTATGDANFTVEPTQGDNNTSLPGPLLMNVTVGQAKIVGGTTGGVIRNNADSGSNASWNDAGLWTLRNGLLIPRDAANNIIAPNTTYATMPIKIDDQLLSGTAASITFAPNPLPTGFRHLLIEIYARTDQAAASTRVTLRFNNDSGANYDEQEVYTTAATTTASELLATAAPQPFLVPGNTATANYFGVAEIKIYHYQSTVGNKLAVINAAEATGNATTNNLRMMSFVKWRTTGTAITRIDLIPSGGNFVTGSLFTLWGIP